MAFLATLNKWRYINVYPIQAKIGLALGLP